MLGQSHGATGVVYDMAMAEPRCLWDNDYPECPERFTSVLNRFGNRSRKTYAPKCMEVIMFGTFIYYIIRYVTSAILFCVKYESLWTERQ